MPPFSSPDCPPPGLIASEVFWTGLILTLEDSSQVEVVTEWMKKIFGTWMMFVDGVPFIKLDGPSARPLLSVSFEFVGQSQSKKMYRPNASLEGHRVYAIDYPDRECSLPAVVAFHSVKGGVGRTTAAMAFAHNLSDYAGSSRPILFVDADFEAPGTSYLYRTRKPNVNVSLEDLLAIAHADTSIDLSDTVDFVAAQMLDQRIGNMFVLPVKRLMDDLTGFTIRPEHLVSARRNQPYLIVDLVRLLAKKLNCQLAVVDLRAGLVDIALHFLTDPSVERVFVTTPSGQSVNALSGMLKTLGNIESQTGSSGRQPFVLINQVPRVHYDDPVFRGELQARLETLADIAFFTALNSGKDQSSEDAPVLDSSLAFGFLYHVSDLILSADDWDAYLKDLDRTNFAANLKTEMEGWASSRFNAPEVLSENQVAAPERSEACALLASFSSKLEFAETVSEVQRPLITPPLQRLLNDFVQNPPVTVIEGTKGTGKTLTFRYLVEQETWRKASAAMGTEVKPSFDGGFLPVLGSVNSSENMQELLGAGRARIAGFLGTNAGLFSSTTAAIRNGLSEKWGVSEWTDFWLESIAKAVGVDSWRQFVELAQTVDGLRPIAMFEGLEEEFTNPYTDVVQADALRALIREVPIRLREEAGRPVGILVFARSDMVEAVIEQNVQQFRASYKSYALTWRDLDIQELVVWLADNSGAMPGVWTPAWRSRLDSEREADLRSIWGLKLGTDAGNEARSTEWVIAVLTDLTGRLTARDLVRFINQAAFASKDQTAIDRLLTANAMRKAVEYTSKQKVDEYPKEVRELLPIFQKLRSISDLATPFDRAEAAVKGIDLLELNLLEKYGVAYSDEGSFEVPELFRIGLNMKRKGARPNIISLTRKARERAKI
jgi:cellulose biosynthesis protein BcsQ